MRDLLHEEAVDRLVQVCSSGIVRHLVPFLRRPCPDAERRCHGHLGFIQQFGTALLHGSVRRQVRCAAECAFYGRRVTSGGPITVVTARERTTKLPNVATWGFCDMLA